MLPNSSDFQGSLFISVRFSYSFALLILTIFLQSLLNTLMGGPLNHFYGVLPRECMRLAYFYCLQCIYFGCTIIYHCQCNSINYYFNCVPSAMYMAQNCMVNGMGCMEKLVLEVWGTWNGMYRFYAPSNSPYVYGKCMLVWCHTLIHFPTCWWNFLGSVLPNLPMS